jgi:uncharacterized protein (TIGR02118 family)
MRFGMAPRRAGWSLAEFQTYWRDQHAPVVCGMPGLRAYLQNHAVLEHGEPLLPWPGFDACAQFGAADPSDFELAFSSLHYTGPVTDDARRFVDTTRGGTMLCDPLDLARPQGTTAAPIGGERVRLLRFLRAAPGVPMDGFLQALRQLEVPQDALGRELHPGSSAAPRPNLFDAVEILGFADPDAALRHVLGGAERLSMEPLAGWIRGTERLIARVAVVR